jgi:hypothetical protein
VYSFSRVLPRRGSAHAAGSCGLRLRESLQQSYDATRNTAERSPVFWRLRHMSALLTKRLRTVCLPGLAAVVLADVFPSPFFRGKLLSGLRINVGHAPLRVLLFVPWLWGLVTVGGLA